jgi:hypothetical protein
MELTLLKELKESENMSTLTIQASESESALTKALNVALAKNEHLENLLSKNLKQN